MDSQDLQDLAQESIIIVDTSSLPYQRCSSPPWSERALSPSAAPIPTATATPTPLPTATATPTPFPTATYQRYSSTPWSKRALSPSATPTPSILMSSVETPIITDTHKEGRGGWRLTTEADKTTILRICYQFKDLYGRISMAKFWKDVATKFSEVTGHPVRTTLARGVSSWIKERQDFLAALESGEQDQESSYTSALDLWISVHEEYKQGKEAEKEAQGRLDHETEQSKQWRLNMFSTWSDKSTLLGTKRDYINEESSDSESSLHTSSTPALRTTESSPAPGSLRRPPKRQRQQQNQQKSEDVLADSITKLVSVIVEQKASNSVTSPTVQDTTIEDMRYKEVSSRLTKLEDGIDRILAALQQREL